MSMSTVAGIDVAKPHVDAFVLDAERKPWRFISEADGHWAPATATALAPRGVGLVVMEATGGYEAALACALQAAGLAMAVFDSQQARDFARAMGRLAKTEALDANVLAAFTDACRASSTWPAAFGRSPMKRSVIWRARSLGAGSCWR